MLERISNISLDADFKKSKKGRYSSFKGGIYSRPPFNLEDNDSISFSPASKYLSKANWLLKEFNQSSEDKVVVEFIYRGFNFEVSLDLQRISSIETIMFVVHKDNSMLSDNNSIVAMFKVSLGDCTISQPIQKELRGLEQLFQRFTSLELKSELNIYNYELIDTLLEGIYSLLQSDFTYLNNVLLKFLEKQTNKKFKCLFDKKKGTSTQLNLVKIKPNKVQ